MKTIRSFTCLIHSFRFTVVLRSSSIIPILTVFFFNFKTFSTLSKSLLVNETSSGPCIFGFTIYTEPVLEFFLFFKSCFAHSTVIKPSKIPSGISEPSLNSMELLFIRCPTFLFKIRDLPCSVILLPSIDLYFLSEFNFLINFLPFFSTSVFKSPFMIPSQFL